MRILSFAILQRLLMIASVMPVFGQAQSIATGQAAFGDWDQQQAGAGRKITVADLPAPNSDEAVNNTPHLVPAEG